MKMLKHIEELVFSAKFSCKKQTLQVYSRDLLKIKQPITAAGQKILQESKISLSEQIFIHGVFSYTNTWAKYNFLAP